MVTLLVIGALALAVILLAVIFIGVFGLPLMDVFIGFMIVGLIASLFKRHKKY